MKLEKKHYTIIAVVIGLIAVWYFFLRKKKPAESGYAAYQLDPNGIESGFAASMGKVPSRIKGGGTPVPQGKWISSTEGGQDYCRWYNANGDNTVTYERACTKAQANM
jgi:hypothetical protein